MNESRCYRCKKPAAGACARCGRPFCLDHGSVPREQAAVCNDCRPAQRLFGMMGLLSVVGLLTWWAWWAYRLLF